MDGLKKRIKQYLADRAWDKLRPGDLAKSVAIEAGELLENFQWDNPELDVVKQSPEKLAKIQKELADVLIYCLDMAVLLELDVEKIVNEKLDYIEKKYPAELFKNNGGKEPGTEDIYWKIKQEYRQKGEV